MRAMTPAGALLAVLVIALLGAMALAGVIALEPVSTALTAMPAPVVLVQGPANGTSDLQGTVSVSVDPNGTRATVTIHPTYQVTLYTGLLNVTNRGNYTYNLSIVVDRPAQIPGGWAYLVVWNGTAVVATVNLSVAGSTGIGSLAPGGTLQLWIATYFPEGRPLQSVSAGFYVAYSPSGEAAPVPPG